MFFWKVVTLLGTVSSILYHLHS